MKKGKLSVISGDADDMLMEIHSTYQKIEFTEEDIEFMCKEANILMRVIPPQSLILNPSSFTYSVCYFRLPLRLTENSLDYYIKAYSHCIFGKSMNNKAHKKSLSQKLKNILEDMTYYGTEAVTKAYSYIA